MVPDRWLVLGAGGRLGRVLCTPERPWLIPTTRANVDASDPQAIRAAVSIVGAVGVLNLAAAADVARCECDPAYAFEGNVQTTAAAVRGAFAAGVGLVQVSTDYVFGDSDASADALPVERAPWWPNSTRKPVNGYGKSKAAAEDAMAWALVRYRSKPIGSGFAWKETVISEEEYTNWASKSALVRMSFLADPPGYAWVIGGVRVTKEWIEPAADRLARFLVAKRKRIDATGTIVHLVTPKETTLDALVRERYPDVPVVPYEEGLRRLPYRIPRDLRLGGAWSG